MVLKQICPPALIYLIFSITQVFIDISQGVYNTAFIKIWVSFIFTILLNYLCKSGLTIISWLIVFIPFILMTVIVSILLFMFGLDPSSGKLAIAYDKNIPHQQDARESMRKKYRRDRGGRRDHGDRRDHGGRIAAEDEARRQQYDRISTTEPEYNMSGAQSRVLDDVVSARAKLSCDPLHDKNCKV